VCRWTSLVVGGSPTYDCVGFPGIYGYESYNPETGLGTPVEINVESPTQQGQTVTALPLWFPVYGLAENGGEFATNLSCTPAMWFEIYSDAVNDSLRVAQTHEDIRSVSIGAGQSIGTLLTPRRFIDVTDTPVGWAGSLFTDSAFVYPPLTNSNWRRNVKISGADPDEVASIFSPDEITTHYAYTWMTNAFCQTQAARYGI
jgi:hypothetical protein